MIVTMRHVRAAKICSGGARKFCIRHGIDWADFLKNGVNENELLETGDAIAIDLVRVARGRK